MITACWNTILQYFALYRMQFLLLSKDGRISQAFTNILRFHRIHLNKWKGENANIWHDAPRHQGTKFWSQTTSFPPPSETPAPCSRAFLEETVLNRTSPICSCSQHQEATGPDGAWRHTATPFYTTAEVTRKDQPPCHHVPKVDAICTNATTTKQVGRGEGVLWSHPFQPLEKIYCSGSTSDGDWQQASHLQNAPLPQRQKASLAQAKSESESATWWMLHVLYIFGSRMFGQ